MAEHPSQPALCCGDQTADPPPEYPCFGEPTHLSQWDAGTLHRVPRPSGTIFRVDKQLGPGAAIGSRTELAPCKPLSSRGVGGRGSTKPTMLIPVKYSPWLSPSCPGSGFSLKELTLVCLIYPREISRSQNRTWASLVAQMVKNLPARQETRVQSLGQEDSVEKGMATYSSILAWRIPGTEEPGGHGVGHDWATVRSLPKFFISYLQ